MPKYNISHKKPFEILNIVGNLKKSNPEILIFGSYKDEKRINDTNLEKKSFYGDNIISERGIWSAIACSSGYINRNHRFQDYGVIIQTLPLEKNMQYYMKDQVRTQGPYYLCNPLITDLVLAITPWRIASKTLYELALMRASNFLNKGQMRVNVGGHCDKRAQYYHERSLDIKEVRDLTS